jgi:hypothetical protein
MRAFLMAFAAVLVIAAGGLITLGAVQKSSGAAYSTEGTRVSQSNFRRVMQASMESVGLKKQITNTGGLNLPGSSEYEGEDTCKEVSAWQTIFIDFGNKSEDEAACNE